MEFTKESILQSVAEAAERMGLDTEDLVEMLPDVLEDCLGKADQIIAAIASGDSATIKAVAHDIKGSTLNYGLVPPSAIAKELETQLTAGAALADELKAVLEKLNSYGIGV